jgi:hypothetical protein
VVPVNAAVLPSEKEIRMTDYASRDRSRSGGKSGQQDGGAGMEPGKRTLTESLYAPSDSQPVNRVQPRSDPRRQIDE